MVEAARHRGVARVWAGEGYGLAVQSWGYGGGDLSVAGAGDLGVVADARVDNRGDLERELGGVGAGWTEADLILAAYRRWGAGCGERIVGDFAFVVWDGADRRLLAVRDPMGMRPLYYRVESGRRVVVGSEVKQVLSAPGVEVRLDEGAVAAHLAGIFGRLDGTFYEGVDQLAPGHALEVRGEGERVWRYWEVDPGVRVEYRAEGEYAEHFLELFEEAVRCRLVGDRPVGLFLSGGWDSGSIASVAGRLLERGGVGSGRFRAYSWAFETLPECDERGVSGGIAARYGFPVTDVWGDDAWPLSRYPAHGPDRDEPYIGVYQALLERGLALARSEGMGTLLSGDRGDEVVGDWIYDHPGLLRAGRLIALCRELRAFAEARNRSLAWAVRRELFGPARRRLLRRFPVGPRTREGDRARPGDGRRLPAGWRMPLWLRRDLAQRVGLLELVRERTPSAPFDDPARRDRYRRIFTTAGFGNARFSERTWSRFGIAYADPWSDPRLVRFVLAVPQHVVNRATEPKRILRRAMRGVMPEHVRRAVSKTVPERLYDRGFRERARETVRMLLADSRAEARGYIRANAVALEIDRYLRGEPPRCDFWWPLTLEIWLRRYWD